MVVYTLEQRWEVALRSTYRRYRFWQKNRLFRCNSFWPWRVCKHAKLSHLGHRKPTSIHWRTKNEFGSNFGAEALLGHFYLKMSKEKPLQSIRIVIGPCWTNFSSQKLKRIILATFGFNRTAQRATQPKLHSMFCALFLKIIISRRAIVVWPPRSCYFTPLDYYLWGAVKDKCYADKPETNDALKDNIR